jgi:hypothetical protein
MRSEDLIDCQEESREFPICQVGMGTEVGLFEGLMNLGMSSNHPEEMTKKEDQRHLLIIGGIEIFLPLSSVGDKTRVADATTVEG